MIGIITTIATILRSALPIPVGLKRSIADIYHFAVKLHNGEPTAPTAGCWCSLRLCRFPAADHQRWVHRCARIVLLTMGLLTVLSIANAQSDQADTTPVGWHWYNEPVTPPPDKTSKPTIALNALAPETQMAVLHAYTERALKQAVLAPTPDHLYHYVVWQQFWMQHANRFTLAWQAMLLQHPELDYSVEHPTENVTASIQAKARDADTDVAIHQLAAHNGLFFFYRGANPLDQTLMPSIAALAAQYHFALLPISVDGEGLQAMAGARSDQGQAKALGVTHFPALLLVNPATQQVAPINYGFIALDELKARLRHIANHWQEEK